MVQDGLSTFGTNLAPVGIDRRVRDISGGIALYLLLILMFSAGADEKIWTTEASGIPSPLTAQQVAIHPDGDIFLLDIAGERRILHYHEDLGFVQAMAGLASGSGKFPLAYRIAFHKDQLVVHEFNGIHLFTMDGKHLKTINPPSKGGNLDRLVNGWLVVDKKFGSPYRTYTVSIASESMLNKTKLDEWRQRPVHQARCKARRAFHRHASQPCSG